MPIFDRPRSGCIATALSFAAANNRLSDTIIGIGAAINEMSRGQGATPQGVPAQQPRSRTTPRRQQVSPQQRADMDLQRNLNALDFDAGPVDGRPGERTRRAAAAFRESRNFDATGGLSDTQRAALARAAPKRTATTAAPPWLRRRSI